MDLHRLKCFCCLLKEARGGKRWEGSCFFWGQMFRVPNSCRYSARRLNSGGTLCGVKGPVTIWLVLLIQLVLPNCFSPLSRTGFNALGSVGNTIAHLMATKYEYIIVLDQYLSRSFVGLYRVSVVWKVLYATKSVSAFLFTSDGDAAETPKKNPKGGCGK